jgi:putative chitinase
MRTINDWTRVLLGCGVRPEVVNVWASVFADTIKDDTFSAGDTDLVPFLAQMMVETGHLECMVENLNYTADRLMAVWPHRFQTIGDAMSFAHNPEALANRVYGGRMGNDEPGDGWRYRGRGPGITGKDNYHALGELMGEDLLTLPGLIEQPHFGLEAFIHWWENRIPDSALGDPKKVSELVNGGDTGLSERISMTEKVKEVLA